MVFQMENDVVNLGLWLHLFHSNCFATSYTRYIVWLVYCIMSIGIQVFIFISFQATNLKTIMSSYEAQAFILKAKDDGENVFSLWCKANNENIQGAKIPAISSLESAIGLINVENEGIVLSIEMMIYLIVITQVYPKVKDRLRLKLVMFHKIWEERLPFNK